MTFNKSVLVLVALFQFVFAYGQHILPLHRSVQAMAELLMCEDSTLHQTAFRPFIVKDGGELFQQIYKREEVLPGSWVHKKLRYESLFQREAENYRLAIDPILGFEIGDDNVTDKYLYKNSRGIQVNGRIGEKLSYYSVIYENQVAFPDHVNEFIEKNTVIPHASELKPYEIPLGAFSPNGYDYTFAEGAISFSPIDKVNIQMGQGKHFVGEGYRSMLLSDNSYSYPYIQGRYKAERFQYLYMFIGWLNHDLPQTESSGFHKKHATVHYVSGNVAPWLQLGLFESIIFNPQDSSGYTKPHINYFNPVVFAGTMEYGLGSRSNVLIGVNAKISPFRTFHIYGQLAVDEMGNNEWISQNKLAWQTGIKWFNALGFDGLFARGELNHANPYAYGHHKVSQNYTHSHQALAHPLGANFDELVGTLRYSFQDFELELLGSLAVFGDDTATMHSGNNLFLSDKVGEAQSSGTLFHPNGVETKLLNLHMCFSYLLNPRTNLRLYAGAAYRKKNSELIQENSTIVFFGFRTFLRNNMFDF